MLTSRFERNRFVGAKIINVQSYGADIKIFEFECKLKAKPGQFIMLWLPGIGERPFSPTKTNPLELAVKKRGLFTKKMFELKVGDCVGIRGPYGKGFKYENVKHACLVAGGIGIAALVRLAETLSNNGAMVDFVYGVRKRDQLVFLERIEKVAELFVSTEDGSFGKKGTCIELLKRLLASKRYDCIYCCGPEPMMVQVLALCKHYNIKSQFSLERRMKCAVGICGHCALGSKLVCKDGPVFSGKTLASIREFMVHE
ncbi:MAG: dihydroorotate dehydrogenase electron transfer subunit [Candidatus Diapherotrites archaeon]|nr:dihydroorotate dehydrogenase electron transfer subunit [Candidatus Diapherotrites archaeon]